MTQCLVVCGKDENREEKQEVGKHFARKSILFYNGKNFKRIIKFEFFYLGFSSLKIKEKKIETTFFNFSNYNCFLIFKFLFFLI